jgi:uncharacterized lipoprotein
LGDVVKKLSFVVLGLMVLTSCSRYSSSGESVYLKSHNGPKVTVPSPLSGSNISTFYDLPEQKQDAKINIDPPIE